jgi:hypothetical protein
MPRDGAIIFADLIGKLDVLYVHCEKCGRESEGQFTIIQTHTSGGVSGNLYDQIIISRAQP